MSVGKIKLQKDTQSIYIVVVLANILLISLSVIMTENLILYIIIWIIWILIVFSIVAGIEKMIKIILGNYILGWICLAASQSIELFVNFLNAAPESKLIWMSYKSLWVFCSDAKMTLVLILYAVLLVVIYKTSKIQINLPEDPMVTKGLYVLFVPLTVLSMILTLQIAIMWINVFSMGQLQIVWTWLANYPSILTFLTMMPVWIFLHGVATVLITSELKIGLRTGI